MEQKFIPYLEAMGITEALHQKITNCHDFYTKFLSIEIIDIYISDYVNQEGARIYENLWFFSDKYCMEAKNFLTEENYDIDYLLKNISTFAITKTDYDIVGDNFSDKSRLRIDFSFLKDESRVGETKASKENCNYLKQIFLKYILPNLYGY